MTAQAALKEDLKDVKTSAGIYDDDLHARFVLWKDQQAHSLTRIAAMLNRSITLVSQYVNRKYPGDLPEIEKDISNLLRREEDFQFVSGPKEFCSTTPAKLIWEVLQYCDEKQKMGVALAPSGTGKTETLKEYKRQNRATVFVTADVSTRALSAVLRLIAKHTGGPIQRATTSERLHAVIDRLKGSRRMIVVDDAHFLTWEAFELIRKIHDCAGIGIVYIGQERLYEQMKGSANKAYLFDQIFSRIAIKREGLTPKKTDARKIALSICPGLDKDCVDHLYHVARGKGRLRVMVNLIEVAMEMSKQYDRPINLELLHEAESFLMQG